MPHNESFCFYEELGVQKSASTNEIREAYKKLALRFHPDRNPEKILESEERFKRISRAYKVLSDPKQRDAYNFNPSSFHRAEGDGMPNFPFAPGFQPMGFDFPLGGQPHFSFHPGMFHGMHQRTPWGMPNHPTIFDLLFAAGVPNVPQRAVPEENPTSNTEFVQRLFIFVAFLCLTSGVGAEIVLSGLHLVIFVGLLVFIGSLLRKRLFP